MENKVLIISVLIGRPSGNPDHDTLSDEEYAETMTARVRDSLVTEGGYVPPSSVKSLILTCPNPFTHHLIKE